MQNNSSNTIELPVRQYSAVPTSQPRGLVTTPWQLDIATTALIELHCWNIGVAGGPAVPEDRWVFVGSPQNHRVMEEMVTHRIAPLLRAARRAGMPVVHVQSDRIAERYTDMQPPMPPPAPAAVRPPSVTSHWQQHTDVTHGVELYQWDGWNDLDVAAPVYPQAGDVMIATTDQFDTWLRAKRITTLLYTGFCTNLCILESPAAMKAMRDRGYRCVILREATLGCEFPDTQESLDHTRAAIQYIEAWVGYSASAVDLQGSLEQL